MTASDDSEGRAPASPGPPDASPGAGAAQADGHAGGPGAGAGEPPEASPGEASRPPEAKASPKSRASHRPRPLAAGPPPARPGKPVALRRPQDAKASPRPRPAREPARGGPGALTERREGPDGEPLATLKASPRVKVPSGRRPPEPLAPPKGAKPGKGGGCAEAGPSGFRDGPPPAPAKPLRVPMPPRRLSGADAGQSPPGTVAVSARAKGVTPFMVMEVLERARELEALGRTVIHMEVGEPDFPTPGFIVEAMRQALGTGASFGYAHSLGDPELRGALARHYRRRYGLEIGPERFLVCPGTSVGMALLFGALLEPGDKVALTDPCYSCYPNFVRFCGGEPVFLKVREKDGFRVDPDELKSLLARERGVKAVLVNSPANPTGAVLDPERLKAIAGLGAFVVSDEIYHGLSYQEERDHSILEYTDRCAVVGGLSKSWAMTGWRVGHLALPPDLARPLQKLAQNFVISVNSAVQKAAVAALDEGWPEVERMRAVYDSRRKLLLDGLRRLGLGVMAEPAGAFYILARADHVNPDSKELVFEILEEAGVGCVPGREFGAGAEGFLRFSYAVSSEGIEEALRRLEGFLARRGKLPA